MAAQNAQSPHCEQLTFTRRGAFKIGASALLALLASPQLAWAEPQASEETLEALSDAQQRYEQAQGNLEALGDELEQLAYQAAQTEARVVEVTEQIAEAEGKIESKQGEIDDTTQQIGQTEEHITQTEEELADDQEQLSKRISSSYKAGSINFIDVLLASSTMDEFLENITYMDRIAAHDRKQIDDIKKLSAQLEAQRASLEEQRGALEVQRGELEQQKSDLEGQRANLEGLQADLEAQQAGVMAKQEEAASLLASLDSEVRDLMAQRDAEIQAAREEEERKAREAAARAAAAAAASSGSSVTEGVPAVTEPGLRGDLMEAALSLLGTPYVWGGTWPESGGTDCSGLMMWTFSTCGYDIPRTTYGQIDACSRAGHLFYDASQLQPGDLVFTNGGGHVGMYLGNGNVVHDPSPGGVVMVSPLTRWSSLTCFGFPIP